jgi:hypothetical protein
VAVYTAPVTEVAFLNLPEGYGEAEKAIFDKETASIGNDVKEVGKSWGSATGWSKLSFNLQAFSSWPFSVVETFSNNTEPAGEKVALLGVFGYASIEGHMKWRETPEHAKAMEIMGEMAKKTGLTDTKASILQGRAMFHVHFQASKWISANQSYLAPFEMSSNISVSQPSIGRVPSYVRSTDLFFAFIVLWVPEITDGCMFKYTLYLFGIYCFTQATDVDHIKNEVSAHKQQVDTFGI